MVKSKIQREPLPEEFRSIEEAAKFWDTHSLADYEDLQKDVDFEVELKSEKNYFAVEKELSDMIDKLAHVKGILPETLVNLWLKEKILEKAS
ncbi:MAG TPA: CopG family antitoxin [Thermodesulfovibrionia bacterium]|nr:CopG family antitoxin [Thermodesulfovibrionia bacterium]